MGHIFATVAAGLLVVGLFWLDPAERKVSPAMWAPYVWLLIASSRPLSNWLTLSGPGGASEGYVDGSPLDRSVLTLLLVTCLYFLSKRWQRAKAIVIGNPAILIFFAYCLVSLLWCDYPFVSFKRWIRSVGDIAVVVLIVTQ